MMVNHHVRKNGNGAVVFTWDIDPTQPPIKIVGNEYRFNNTLISSKYFNSQEDAMSSLNATQMEFQKGL
jgi:hypothetical protein